MILWLRLFVVMLALALPLAIHGTAAPRRKTIPSSRSRRIPRWGHF